MTTAETTTTPEPWRDCWRVGVAPALSTPGLCALVGGLRDDDPRLLQHATTYPDYGALHPSGWGVEGACAVAYAAWLGDGADTLWRVCDAFTAVCDAVERTLRVPGAIFPFLDWYDRTPRDEMRPALLAEVQAELTRREGVRWATS